MEIDYKTFKEDCKEIIQPVLEKYGYVHDIEKSEDYINYYVSRNGYIKVSLLENFPHVGVSLWCYPLNLKFIRPSIIDEKLGVSKIEKADFYKEFKSNNDLNNYSIQMHYAIEIMEKFYKPILTGEVKIDEII